MFTNLFQLQQKPVTTYSSQDDGAPILTAAAGSLKTVLEACLVTGYGDKQSLGWQKVFESQDKNSAAFKSQSPDSSGYHLKVDSAEAIPKLSAYKTMTALDNGAKPMAENLGYDHATSDWMLIGHDKTFVLLLNIVLRGYRVAFPLLFGDLPKQTARIADVCVLWCGRREAYHCGGVQSTLFRCTGGSGGYPSSSSSYNDVKYATCYPFRVNTGSAGENLTANACRFNYGSQFKGTVLYEPILSVMSDSTWTFLPMFLPLSAHLTDIGNLGKINETTLKAQTGSYAYTNVKNHDCAVPIDWWWA